MGSSNTKTESIPAADGKAAVAAGSAVAGLIVSKRIWEPETQLHPVVLGGKRGTSGLADTGDTGGGAERESEGAVPPVHQNRQHHHLSTSADSLFSFPSGLCVDPTKGSAAVLGSSNSNGKSGGGGVSTAFPVMHAPVLVVADSQNARVRKLDRSGVVSTLASGKEKEREKVMTQPMSVCVDSQSNVYVCDTASHCIRKITPDGTVSILVGTPHTAAPAEAKSAAEPVVIPTGDAAPKIKDGSGSVATLWYPTAIAIDSDDSVYVCDAGHFCVRKISTREVAVSGTHTPRASAIAAISTAPSAIVRTLSGRGNMQGYKDGTPEDAMFGRLAGIAVDSKQNIYVSDYQHHTIRKIAPDTGMVSTVAGRRNVAGQSDGAVNESSSEATFNGPMGLCFDNDDNLYVADSGNGTIRKIITRDGQVRTINISPKFVEPCGIAWYAGQLYVTEPTTHLIYKIDLDASLAEGAAERTCFKRMCT